MTGRVGLGCMRLSTSADRNEETAIRVIHAALDAGARFLDTADAYARDESDVGHNERLIARALESWAGDATAVEVATKGGLKRPGGRWVPDGRAKYLREACERSCNALGVNSIDLYQLHAVDPRTRLETSVRALASLRDAGRIRHVGLCNVTVEEIRAARAIVEISTVQIGMGVLDPSGLRNGVAEYCRDEGIRLVAYRPLGGQNVDRLKRNEVLRTIAAGHGASPHEIALAWLLDLDDGILAIPGATRVETARSAVLAAAIRLTDGDRERLDAEFPAGRLLRVPRARRRPAPDATGEVVIVMGAPGAGKSTVAREFVERGYERLNRDERGGTLSNLVIALRDGLAAGERRWVLDNTYPTRAARNEVIECAWSFGIPVRCVWLQTTTADAQINAVRRLLEDHGRLPMPEELRERGRTDNRWFGPDAQFRYERQLEAPTAAEGFRDVEARPFSRAPASGSRKALFLEFDEVLCNGPEPGSPALSADAVHMLPERRARIADRAAAGWIICAIAWRPQLASEATDGAEVRAAFHRVRELLGVEIDIAWCPHPAGPPVCWCRKPLPGLVLELAERHDIALGESLLIGRASADRTLAERLGIEYAEHHEFFR